MIDEKSTLDSIVVIDEKNNISDLFLDAKQCCFLLDDLQKTGGF